MGAVVPGDPPLVALADIHPSPWNPRTITEEDFDALMASLERWPQFLLDRPCIVQASSGDIAAGNMRYRGMRRLASETGRRYPNQYRLPDGRPGVPTRVRDMSDAEARALALIDNNILGSYQPEEVGEILHGLGEVGIDPATLAFRPVDLEAFLEASGGGSGREHAPFDADVLDEVPPAPQEPISNLGDLWLLGEHRLLCGDATRRADLLRLMDGRTAEMVWTDPPYGVTYAGGSRPREVSENDDLDTQGIERFLEDALGYLTEVVEPGGAWYVCSPPGPLHTTFGLVLGRLGIHHQTRIWVKNNATFAPLGQDFHWRHEPILYGWQPGAAHRYRGDRTQESVIFCDRPSRSPEHPTMKPIRLVTDCIELSSDKDDIVLDPFLGSGTTLVAADVLGRVCYGIEIDPIYVDVIVARWERQTGLTARKA
jgi:DNA modification methylase